MPPNYREAIRSFVEANAKPPDKFSHQPRLYRLAASLANGKPFDDDVLYAAAWLHDLGVFIGHRPEDPTKLAAWDHLAYAMEQAPRVLEDCGFPPEKTPSVIEVIRTHMPSAEPTLFEGTLLQEADILEQLGAVGILRTVSKVGRDTRFVRFSDALRVLKRNLDELPGRLRLESSRKAAEPRVRILKEFLSAAETEAADSEW